MKSSLLLCAALLLAFVCSQNVFAQGSLEAADKNGKSLGACPLKHTNVKAEISGFLARVRVKQEFENNFAEKIEAVYTFPLPQMAAVDDMTMTVGTRVVRGKILKREEAREVYEAAKSNGQAAALLDQERPNIFTQSVANILPGEKVTVEISYVETLKYDGGTYEFVFPTVVAPRYNPAQVRDVNKISPPIAKTRAGHDISIEVALDAGVPIESFVSKSHLIETTNLSASRAIVRLQNQKTIPNKDFILRYDVSGKKISDAVLTHKSDKGGFFTLILQPPDTPRAQDVTPKEIVFVLDTSGSMEGFPIEKAKEAMRLALSGLYPNDTFNLITFAGETKILFEQPVPATPENLAKARAFLQDKKGDGGTEMMTAIKAALEPSDSQQHVRVVCFMTDGEVGNDEEIIAEVRKHPNARVFSFGIGESVNRYLLEKIAQEGRGEAEFVSLNDDGSAAARRFHERVRSPMLMDIAVDWNGLPVADVYPNRVPDLFSAKPVVIHGRFTGAGGGTIRLKGKVAGQEIVREVPITFPENEPAHDTLATLWARSRVDELSRQTLAESSRRNPENGEMSINEEITNLGLEFRLLTQFTSFVAVEELIITDGGQPRRVEVPVELPEGMKNSRDSFENNDEPQGYVALGLIGRRNAPRNLSGFGVGQGSGNGSGNTNNVIAVEEFGATATVEVTASNNGSAVSQRQIAKLPVNGRSNSKLKTVPKKRSKQQNENFQVDGTSGSENSFIIDGGEVTNFRTGAVNSNNNVPKVISGGVINGKAMSLPVPAYPPAAKAVRASGAVNVQVTIDENGNVISATAVGGHPLLRAAAVAAAKQAKFTPTQLSGKPVKIAGVVVYNFVNDKPESVTTTLNNFAVELSPEEKKQREIVAKLHPTIFALVERLKDAKAQLAQEEANFVKNGKAEIRVWLADKTPAAIEELKAAGFEVVIDPTTTKFVIGRIIIEKLAALAELKSVTFIAPQAN